MMTIDYEKRLEETNESLQHDIERIMETHDALYKIISERKRQLEAQHQKELKVRARQRKVDATYFWKMEFLDELIEELDRV
jgi:hypothetical protein